MEKFPLLSTLPLSVRPSLNVKLIFVSTSAVPLIEVSSVVILLAFGATGGILSIMSIYDEA